MSIQGRSVTGSCALIALGANLPSRYGEPEETLLKARDVLAKNVHILDFSRIWLTAPVPVSDQPWYRNAVMLIETTLDVFSLFRMLKDIEKDFGRVAGDKNAARILDLDLIDFDGNEIQSDHLILPHPRMHERAFVLQPLMDILPDWIHPVLKKSLSELMAAIPAGQAVLPRDAGQ